MKWRRDGSDFLLDVYLGAQLWIEHGVRARDAFGRRNRVQRYRFQAGIILQRQVDSLLEAELVLLVVFGQREVVARQILAVGDPLTREHLGQRQDRIGFELVRYL